MNDVVLKIPEWSFHSGYAEPGWRLLCFLTANAIETKPSLLQIKYGNPRLLER